MHTNNISQNHDEMIPLEFHLSQNYPNPFKRKTRIKYCIAYKAKVTLTVFNSKDKLVKKIVDKEQEAGTYEIEFDADSLDEGIYFYKLRADSYTAAKKMKIQK